MLTPQAVAHQPQSAPILATLFDGPDRIVTKGTRIFSAGDGSETLFLVRRGLVRLSTITPNADVTLGLCRPGDVFGESCLRSSTHSHAAIALERSIIVQAPAGRVFEALTASPELVLELLAILTGRLADAYADLEMLSRPAVIRVAAGLLSCPATTAADGRWSELEGRYTHDHLAHIVGIRRETLTRALARLRVIGLVRCEPGRAIRVHRGGLSALIGTDSPTQSPDLQRQ
jgi:CRP/FNR family transcriptional regulator, cyclic AMP receptor protein